MTEASNNEVARGQFPRVDSVATRGPFLRSQGRLRGTIRNTYIYIYKIHELATQPMRFIVGPHVVCF